MEETPSSAVGVKKGLWEEESQPFGPASVTCMSSASQQRRGGVSQGRGCLCPLTAWQCQESLWPEKMALSQGQGRGSSPRFPFKAQLWGVCPSSRLSYSLAKLLLCGHLDPISSFLPPPISGKRPWAALPISKGFSPRKPSLSSPNPHCQVSYPYLEHSSSSPFSPTRRESLGPSAHFPLGSWLNIGSPWPDCEFPLQGGYHIERFPLPAQCLAGRSPEPVSRAPGTETWCSEAWSQHRCSSSF
ncbi:hypothetical protein J1605_001041 [Eschrichtius robustus]|uniref:Uncharacterized protein n=1 Tax=Eschrichtius robustus TaxID=9764 RepID=A0AB34GP90_ESCRO|nr:hypothetical protein J1605_001041 [Eschrichtius robustus]